MSGKAPLGCSWPVVRLLDVVSLPSGQVDPKVLPYREWPLIAPDHVESDTGAIKEVVSAAAQAAISGKYVFAHGDVLYSKIRPYLRKAVLASFSGLCSADMYPMKPGPDILPSMLLAVLLGEEFTRFAVAVSMRSGIPKINREELQEFSFALPPLPEQRRIAEILDTADEAIRRSEALLAKLEQVKAGLLHDLLTRGLDEAGRLRDPEGHPEQFQDSVLGRIPREWDLRSLQSCCGPLITYGIVQAGPHVENGVPYIRTGDMSGDSLQVEGLLRTSRSIARSYARSEVKAGEIVCAIRATLGKVLEVPPELDGANLTQGTARIAPHPEVCGHYLLWCLRTKPLQSQFEMAQKGTTFAEITLTDLRLLLVPLPPLPEQRRIAAILDSHDARIRAERAQLDKLRQIKKGLMHDLLTGKVRVQVPQEATA